MPAPLLCKTDLPIEGAPRLSGTFPQVLKTHRASPASTPAGDCPRCPPESRRSSSEHFPPLPPAFLLPITALFPSVQSAPPLGRCARTCWQTLCRSFILLFLQLLITGPWDIGLFSEWGDQYSVNSPFV